MVSQTSHGIGLLIEVCSSVIYLAPAGRNQGYWLPPADHCSCTVPKRVLILRTFLAFWVLIGSFFIFQGPYFHYFGFIHAKNVNSVCMYTTIGSGLHCWQILIFTYAYALIFIHRRFGSLFWLLGVLIGSLFHKKMGPYWVLISKLGGPY